MGGVAGRGIGWREAFGLGPPWGDVWREVKQSVLGGPYVPASEWGLSSRKIFKPRIGWATWRRQPRPDGRVPIYNFVNRTPRARTAPYSVKVETCRDWRGGQWSYDGHLGTDFACPIGTPIVAAATGVVVRVAIDLAMGGRKVCIDHGDGLFTTSNHLARALVAEGDVVPRGGVIGLSGVSGLEFVFFFPWVAPHLHYNVWLDGEVADPFAMAGEPSLWRQRNDPVPMALAPDDGDEPPFRPTDWDLDALDDAIAACRDPQVRATIRAFREPARRAGELLVLRNYRPAMFDAFPSLYPATHERTPRLDLPFRAEEYVGVALPDDGVAVPVETLTP
jgi:murein DD-endopeptidase MepM/ murein hydrolase activator NlpD